MRPDPYLVHLMTEMQLHFRLPPFFLSQLQSACSQLPGGFIPCLFLLRYRIDEAGSLSGSFDDRNAFECHVGKTKNASL